MGRRAPGNLGTGEGNADEWKKSLATNEFKSEADAIAYKPNPVDNLAPLAKAKAKIPLPLVYADKGTAVPHAENAERVYDRYKALGGPVERVVKPGQDHHPHGLKDVTPVVTFFADALGPKNRPRPATATRPSGRARRPRSLGVAAPASP